MKEKILISLPILLTIAIFGVLLFLLFTLQSATQVKQVAQLVQGEQVVGPAIEVPTEIIEPKKVTLQFFGDIMLDRDVVKVMGNQGLDYIFAKNTPSSTVFVDADMTVANLEGPFAPNRIQTSKSIAFRFDPIYAAKLKEHGFDAFNLANNHSYDMGRQNVAFTRETLQKNGLGYFGDEYNQGSEYTYVASAEQNLPFPVAFIGLNTTEGPIDMEKVVAAVEDAKSRSKFVIVNIHWGEEYHPNSNQAQQNLAHELIDLGVDAIIGHHPHVIEEVEKYKDRYIFYSLGNFIFDQYWSQPTQEGMSVVLTMAEDGEISWQLIPFVSKRSQIERMNQEKTTKFFDWIKKNSRNINFSS